MIQKIQQEELRVMKFIWEKNDEVISKEVIEFMENKYNCKHYTTFPLLSKLVKKEFLSAEKIGKYTYYKIVVGKREYLNFKIENFIGKRKV
ncbi:TPA: BlaI/MecI/CopY family transcriptional regulator [Clostridioides difficile]